MAEEQDLGPRLRELRERAGLSLRAVAREMGISPSAVSQLERGRMRPSVSRLIAYVGAVGAPLAAVFDHAGEVPEAELFAVRRAGEAEPIELGGGVSFRRLSPVPVPGVEFFESTYPGGAVSTAHRELLRHEGYEVGSVSRGELTIEFENETVVLAAGDSVTFPCHRPHMISNRSPETAVATWLIVHP
ncbi:helix-turn-helix domain-containing protein [Nonomuraea sp. NPDC050663]|uniref:helix-turn-helix domain-containing protein n=1 Tax=Nonomuraea sp. NPDC050663 TaxID=3364370 RepID=UPI0037BA1AE4